MMTGYGSCMQTLAGKKYHSMFPPENISMKKNVSTGQPQTLRLRMITLEEGFFSTAKQDPACTC